MEKTKMSDQLLSNLVLPIVVNLVSPKIEAVLSKYAFPKKYSQKDIEKSFEKYLKQRYEKFLVIDTLVFPNKQTLFSRLYQPLTISLQPGIHAEERENVVINCYPKELLPKYCRIIIEDTAGMGKSTITRKLFISIIEESAGIPILIDLRHLKASNNILNEIQSQLSSLGKKFDIDLILKIIDEGGFVFLFDGFDEIALANREIVINELHTFIEKANNNYFLITSRPEESLSSFGDFQKANVNPLTREEAYALIRKYDIYSYRSIADDLIKQLNENHDDSLTEFLENPFLVSLLYKSYEYKKDIPVKKSQFYNQVYNALFENHDLSKEGYLKRDKYSNLHIDDFERVLRYMGYLTAIDNNVDYDKDSLTNIIDRAKNHLHDLHFKSSDFLSDLLNTVPLFKKDGNNIRWSHKSLQDYFAAKFIWIDAQGHQEAILRKIYDDPSNSRFFNMLDIFYELDPNAFDRYLVYWLLNDFKDTYTKLDLSFKDRVSKDAIVKRAERSFLSKAVISIPSTPHKSKDSWNLELENSFHTIIDKMTEMKLLHMRGNLYYTLKPPRVIFTLRYHSTDSSKETILDLLGSRRPELIQYKTYDPESVPTVEPLHSVAEDVIHFVNVEKSNVLNAKENFEITNELLDSGIYLKFEESMTFLNQLEKQQEKFGNNEFLNW
ncbi:NACHT domain-containing protein [Pontibacter sp. JH31]|uniref:NACHT domain-containing protein n=1 Tax=Pontibacter aquaedesilientis TaxID=2766980 RepID=A0ABR7XNQ4_9BACT|nr:NACHT domain-containing protein [Pontibacter aquaedesilientis]MBD1399041.1 NACHT domain-containing protein [Pontibacter aquaedesilientis]